MSYIDDRKKLSADQLVVEGPLANAYRYPHPNALMMFDPQSKTSRANAERVERVGGLYVFPHVYSLDQEFLQFLDRLSVRLTNNFPATVDPATGYTHGNGVRGNFFGIRHVPGVPMTPATFTLASNKKRRSDNGLVNDGPVEEWHRICMLSWWLLMLDGIQPVPLSVPEGTSSCAPEFTKSVPRKMQIARSAFENAQQAGLLMLEGDYTTPWTKFQLGGCVYIVYRLQVTDKVSYDPHSRTYQAKGRLVADLPYALSGGLEGSLIESDKTKYVQELFSEKGYNLKSFFACRKRTAAGGPWALNAAIGPIADAMRANMYRIGEKTYHDRTRSQKTRDLHEFEAVIMADVSDHDLLWDENILELMVEAFSLAGFADWWIALFYRSMTLPQYISSLSSEDGSTLIGEWEKPNRFSMLLSGNKFTDIAGTGGMTPIYTIGQIEHTAQHHKGAFRSVATGMAWWKRYLNHELDIAQKSKSDDCALLFRTASVVARAQVLQERLVDQDKPKDQRTWPDWKYSPYMVIGYEPGGAYLGDLLYFDSTLKLSNARFIGNIMSFIHNKFCPEYSCPPAGTPVTVKTYQSYSRKFPGLAWRSAVDVYGDCPIFADVLSVVEEEWIRSFGYSFKGYMEQLEKEDTLKVVQYTNALAEQSEGEIKVLMKTASLTAIDREVIADRSKIYYKYTPDEISESIRHVFFTSIPVEEIIPYFNSIVQPEDKHKCNHHSLLKRLKHGA